jgi:ABC-2 type transport system ATP-binding protein
MTPSSSHLAIDVHGLNKTFGDKHVVNDVTIQVEAGRICGFLGPNGSGKTTTLRMLCGLLTPDSGSGQALGFDIIGEADAVKLRTGYMTQKFSLYEDLTIAENLEFTARGLRPDRRRERVDAALERLGLASRRGQLAGTLSGGWKQRLALANCTLHEPKLLLLDEPTAGRRPEGAAHVLGRDPHAGRAGPDGAGLHPLHGRGRALPRDRLHQLRPADRPRHGGGGDRRSPA